MMHELQDMYLDQQNMQSAAVFRGQHLVTLALLLLVVPFSNLLSALRMYWLTTQLS